MEIPYCRPGSPRSDEIPLCKTSESPPLLGYAVRRIKNQWHTFLLACEVHIIFASVKRKNTIWIHVVTIAEQPLYGNIDEKSKHTNYIMSSYGNSGTMYLHEGLICTHSVLKNATASACKYGCYWSTWRSNRLHFIIKRMDTRSGQEKQRRCLVLLLLIRTTSWLSTTHSGD